MTALRAAWQLAIHGPTAIASHPTYSWLTHTPAGRGALRSIWLGLHVACCGNLTLLAIGIRRAELIGGA